MSAAFPRYPVGRRWIDEGPGTFLAESRAFFACARGARLPCLYASVAPLCPVLRAGSMAASEKTYRLYSCGRCATQVRICRDCDRGNQYCAGDCARIRRRESVCRAGARFQSSCRGALLHAARQSAWRERLVQKVTHQGSVPGADARIVVVIPTTTAEHHVDLASLLPPVPLHRRCTTPAVPTCSFCWRVLPPFARLGPLRGGP
jgi:hypothetical protein